MSRPVRVVVLLVVTVLCFGLAGGYLIQARRAASAQPARMPASDGTTPQPALDPSAARAAPHVVFRSTAPGAAFGQLAVAALARPNGPRALLGYTCERAYATESGGVCVTAKRGPVLSFGLATLDRQLRPAPPTNLVGLPSRARMSRDGNLVATTTFVAGHSYASPDFSTETIVRREGRSLGNLESFATTLLDGSPLRAANRNFWGVTFADDSDTFYATAASGPRTWLVRGSLRAGTMTAVRPDAECPSLSPDGTKIAYKKRLARSAGIWQLAVLDLATGQETPLPATRGVDDQVEWLDDDRLLYALPRTGEAAATDVWQVAADGTGQPSVLIEYAASPAVVRP